MVLADELSHRRKDILQKVVFEYIERARPVSSGWLEEHYEMPLSSATIRNELLYLTEEGYLEQPHISAGRVPTDKGYRFLVDEVLAQEALRELTEQLELERKIRDLRELMQEIGKNLAAASSSLIVVYLPQKDFLWKEGWEVVLRAPEFDTREDIGSFSQFLSDVEKGIRDFHSEKVLDIYIGEENPFSKEKSFSIMISANVFPRRQRGLIALVGPKRMEYEKNIGLLNSLQRIFS